MLKSGEEYLIDVADIQESIVHKAKPRDIKNPSA